LAKADLSHTKTASFHHPAGFRVQRLPGEPFYLHFLSFFIKIAKNYRDFSTDM
jgi:hypothetical protein